MATQEHQEISLMKFARVSNLRRGIGRPHIVANKHAIYKLGVLAEMMDIPWKDLAKIAEEELRIEVRDVRELSLKENEALRHYLKCNQAELGERYRKMKWSK
jgi:hypothetical protein